MPSASISMPPPFLSTAAYIRRLLGPVGVTAAVDKKGGGIEIDAEGISYQSNDKAAGDPPPPKGPALLRISYMANVLSPDVYKVKPGSF